MNAMTRLPGMPKDLEVRWDRAVRQLAAAKTDKARLVHQTAKRLIQEEAERRAEEAWMKRAILEQDRLERLRGGGVVLDRVLADVPVIEEGAEVWAGGKRVTRQEYVRRPRLLNRDGLISLLEAGTISAQHYAVGMKYRTIVEATDHHRGLTPPAPGQTKGHRKPVISDTGAVDWTGLGKLRGQARAGGDLAHADAAVASACTSDALEALRAVAGEARTIYSLTGRGGRRRAMRLTAGLIDALDRLGDVWRIGA